MATSSLSAALGQPGIYILDWFQELQNLGRHEKFINCRVLFQPVHKPAMLPINLIMQYKSTPNPELRGETVNLMVDMLHTSSELLILVSKNNSPAKRLSHYRSYPYINLLTAEDESETLNGIYSFQFSEPYTPINTPRIFPF